MPRPKNAAVIVAHPDDEILWAGGAILARPNWSWTIVTVCRGSDPDRAAKFFRVIDRLGAEGAMADLDDGPDQSPLETREVEETIVSVLPRVDYDVVATHSPFGEYTRHRRHEETGRAVTQLWAQGRLTVRQLWLFAYEDGEKKYLPRRIGRAHAMTKLDEKVWKEKVDIMQNTYGFEPDSWEVRATPRVEAFWCFEEVWAFREWFQKEQEYMRGRSA